MAGLLALWCGACSSASYQPALARGFALDAATDVDDASIERALSGEAATPPPALPPQFDLALYAFDARRADALRPKLARQKGVKTIHQLPIELRELNRQGARRSRNYLGSQERASIRRMRLAAARKGCEVLVVSDYGSHYETEPNAWVLTTPLLLPVLFAPMLDVTAESYLDVYVIDVKTGRLIDSVREDVIAQRTGENALSPGAEAMLEAQWHELLGRVEQRLARAFDPPQASRPAQPEPASGGAGETSTEQAPSKAESDRQPPDPFALPVDPEQG